jgi:hypothetical protein
MPKLARLLRWIFLLCCVAVATFYLVAASCVFPAPNGDSASHLVPILNLKAGRGFGGVTWPATRDYDPTGQHRFLQYPPLFHLTVAELIRQPTAADIYLCLGAFEIISLGLFGALIFQPSVGGAGRSQPLWLALACLSVFAASTWIYSLADSGRPEALATPLILLGTLCLLRVPAAWRALIAGIFIGLLGATQIAAACLTGMLFSIYASLQPFQDKSPFWHWLKQAALAACIAVLVSVFCLWLSPYSIADTIHGIALHLSLLGQDHKKFSVVHYFLFPEINAVFYGLLLIVLPIHFLWWRRRQIHWLAALNFAGFVIAAWYFAVLHPNRSYNLLVFSPLFIALALHLVAGVSDENRAPVTRRMPGLVYAVYFGVFALMSIGVARQLVIFEVFKTRGVSYGEARAHLRELLPASADHPILFDGGLWPLLDRFDQTYQRFSTSLSDLDPTPGPEKPVLIVHQWFGQFGVPPEIPGYQLVWNDFIEQPAPRVFGIKVSTETPGYAFAFYKPLAAGQPR